MAERSPGVISRAGGGEVERLRLQLQSDARSGCLGFISFGLAGALDPTLRAGDLIVATEVVSSRWRRNTDMRWADQLAVRLPKALRRSVLGSDNPIVTSSDKLRQFYDLAVGAVDMESHVVAAVAGEHGLPFAILRAIVDTAAEDIPAAALRGMRADGRTDTPALLRALSKDPRQLPPLLRLGRAAGKARAGLLGGLGRLGPGLGFPDLG